MIGARKAKGHGSRVCIPSKSIVSPKKFCCMHTGKLLMHKCGLPSCHGAEGTSWDKVELGSALPT